MAYATFAEPAALESIPYKGDDWAQTLAKWLWLPMLAMGLMGVAFGLAAGIYSGVNVGDFFATGNLVKLGSATATMQWAAGVAFVGMGFILSAITMVLVNVVRTLRDAGRDVQGAIGATQITQLRKPLTGQLIPHVMMMGLAVVIAGLAVGIVQATKLGGIPAAGVANPATLQGSQLADYGTAQALGAWVTALRLLGLAVIFSSIVLALRTIIKAIRFQAQRVEELSGVRAATVAVDATPTGSPRLSSTHTEGLAETSPNGSYHQHSTFPTDGTGPGEEFQPRQSVHTRSLGRYF
jgi:hypothetical protein